MLFVPRRIGIRFCVLQRIILFFREREENVSYSNDEDEGNFLGRRKMGVGLTAVSILMIIFFLLCSFI